MGDSANSIWFLILCALLIVIISITLFSVRKSTANLADSIFDLEEKDNEIYFCKETSLNKDPCAEKQSLVCGSDGITYENECLACNNNTISWTLGKC